MKKPLFFATSFLILSGCFAGTSINLNIDAHDHSYAYDPRTGICYSFTASTKAGPDSLLGRTSGLGKASVACTERVLALAGVNQGKAILNEWGHVTSFE